MGEGSASGIGASCEVVGRGVGVGVGEGLGLGTGVGERTEAGTPRYAEGRLLLVAEVVVEAASTTSRAGSSGSAGSAGSSWSGLGAAAVAAGSSGCVPAGESSVGEATILAGCASFTIPGRPPTADPPNQSAAATVSAPSESPAYHLVVEGDGDAVEPARTRSLRGVPSMGSRPPADGASSRRASVPAGSTPPCWTSAARAAPSAMDDFGSGSIASGRSKSSDSRCATRGMREEPPTRRNATTCSTPMPARSRASSRASSVRSRACSIIPSNSERVSRTVVLHGGTRTGTATSESKDSDSFASMHSLRSWVRAIRASLTSSDAPARPVAVRTWRSTASSKSVPPRSSRRACPWTVNAPPSTLRSTVASKVPPPRSYTTRVSPRSRGRVASKFRAAASGSVRRSMCWSPRSASAARMRPFRCGPHDAGCVTTTLAGTAPSRSVTVSTTAATVLAKSDSAVSRFPATSMGTSSPTLRRNSRRSRSGSVSPRRSAVLPNSSSPSAVTNTTAGM